MTDPMDTRSPDGTLGVLLPGLGAVATTFIAGVESVRRGLAEPIGSVTQMQTIRLGKRTEDRTPLVKDFVPLAGLDQLVFGAWDPIPDDAYESASASAVLSEKDIESVADFLKSVKPMPAVFDPSYVKRLEGPNVKEAASKRELGEQLREDIRRFRSEHGCDRLVMIWCGSTEVFLEAGPAHRDLAAFEAAMESNDRAIAPSMIYAWAALKEGVPYANGAPNLSADIPALRELADAEGVPVEESLEDLGALVIGTLAHLGLGLHLKEPVLDGLSLDHDSVEGITEQGASSGQELSGREPGAAPAGQVLPHNPLGHETHFPRPHVLVGTDDVAHLGGVDDLLEQQVG
ncbi:MAG: inositol-3-phosphate synthase, partial [Longimicrobiales bacterium]